jgi:hypothetical protein
MSNNCLRWVDDGAAPGGQLSLSVERFIRLLHVHVAVSGCGI